MLKRIIISAVLIVSVIINGYSQQQLKQTIRGSVLDEDTGYPLVGATVVISGTDPVVGTTTDANGWFTLNNVAIGRQTLEVSFLGYQKKTVPNILLIGGKEHVLEIRLKEDVTNIDEVVVKSHARKDLARNEMAMVSARTFSVEETERFAGSLGDPARMVANYAGVMTQNDSRNDIIIRGNSPTGVIWRLEGVEIANPNHFAANGTTGGPVSMVNNNLLTNSDFLTGAFPAQYGNGVSGAFDLNLRSGNNERQEYVGQVGFNGFEFGTEGPLAHKKNQVNPSYIANFRYSTLEVMDKLGFDVGTGSAVPKYKDLTFLVDIPGTKSGRFKIFGLLGDSEISLGRDYADSTDTNYTQRGTAVDFSSTLGVTGLTHTYFFNENTKLKSALSLQYSQSKTDYDSVQAGGDIIIPYYRGIQKETKATLSTQFSQKINARNNYDMGLIIDQFYINYQDSTKNRTDVRTDFQGSLYLIRFYGEYQHRFGSNVTGYVGLNNQFLTLNNELSPEPRLGLRWRFRPNQSLNFGYGLHSQMQPKMTYFFETRLEGSDKMVKTNEDIKFTKSHHLVLGYDYLIGNDFRIKLETYYQYLFNVPVKESFVEFSMLNAGDDFASPREDSLVNKGEGRNYGIELTVEKFLSKGYYFLLTTSLFDSKYTGYDGKWRNTAFNGNFVINLLGGYEFNLRKNKWLTMDVKTVYAGGRRYVPIDVEKSIEEFSDERDWSRAYDDKYNNYFRTDLRFGFKMSRKKWTQEWAIDLQNVTGYKSVFIEGWDVEKHETYKVYQQGFLPMFLYRINF